MNVNLTELAKEIHAAAVEKGFWDVEDALDKHLAKMISELGEIVQADRAGIMYEVERDGAKPEGVAAEIADFAMMVIDLLAHYGADFDEVRNVCLNYDELKAIAAQTDAYMVALLLAAKLLNFAKEPSGVEGGSDLSYTIHIAAAWTETHGYDLWEIIRLKMEYNKSRPKLHGRAY